MSGVELRVVLVGEDPEQQAAFNKEFARQGDAAELAETHARDASPAAAIPVPPPLPVVPPPVSPPPSVTPPPVEPIDQRTGMPWADQGDGRSVISSIEKLIEHIDELIKTEAKRSERPERKRSEKSEPAPDGFFDQLSARLSKVVDHFDQIYRDTHFGRTMAGQRLLHTARMARRGVTGASRMLRGSRALRAIGRRATAGLSRRAARAGAGRAVIQGAGNVAHHAVPAAARAGAGGAAAGGAAAAGGTAAVAVVGPLIAVGVAAAGVALSLQQMISAVHHAAESLEDMSPEVAAAEAHHQVAMELARLDRAGRIGEGVARIEAARGKISESMYEVQTKILETILRFAPQIEALLNMINVGVHSVDVIIATINDIMSKINDLPPFNEGGLDNKAAADSLSDALSDLGNALKELRGELTDDQHHGIDPLLKGVLELDFGANDWRGAPPPAGLGGNQHDMQEPR